MPPLDPVASPATAAPLLEPGRNCWRIETAHRLAYLIDGDAYFGAVRAAIANARRSIFILGWDIDSRLRLVPAGANDGWPEPLAEFLDAVVRARPGLRAYLLSWDFAMLYLMEREWLPIYRLDWKTGRRVSFRLDARHPVGASHHQKLVVVDDAVAFVSGFDLTRCRWDTPRHAGDDPLRRDASGEPYGPFHDVGALVDGPCARALGELARERWRRATGRPPRRAPPDVRHDPWPASVVPDARDLPVGIARTMPRFEGDGGVGEIRELHLDLIARARRHLFAENQYFTSRTIAAAFARRLAQPDAPEIAIVTPATQSGWLEVSTMGVLRGRIDRTLRASDRHDRYALYCPTLPWLSDGRCLNVHSKVLEVDGQWLTLGSANLSERSLGLDTECNLVLDARGDPRIAGAIAALRNRLLAEHLGTDEAAVAMTFARTGSLHATIAALQATGGRTLSPLDPAPDPRLDALVPAEDVIDPESPMDPDVLVADLVPHETVRNGTRAKVIAAGLVVVALVALALAWRHTPLRETVNLDMLVAQAERLQGQPLAPLAIVLAYIAGGLVLVPLVLLIAATTLVFGPVTGSLYAFAGALASAATGYALGRALGRDTVRRLAGRRLNALSQRLGRRGLLAVAVVRVVPVAPFAVVNVVAGASHIGWRDFLLGSAIGFLPGILMASVFVDRALAAARHPGPATFTLLVLAALGVIAAITWLRRRLDPPGLPGPVEGGHAG